MSNKYEADTRYLFINTEGYESNQGDQVNNIKVSMGSRPFESNDDSLIKLSLTQFNIAKNWFNINDTNNTFRLIQNGFSHTGSGESGVIIDDTDVLIKIPPGDYLTTRQLQQALCDRLKIALDSKVNASGNAMTYACAPNGDTTFEYGRGVINSNARVIPTASDDINSRLLSITVTASIDEYRYVNPIHIHSLNISPSQGLNTLGFSGSVLTADEQFNDSAVLFGGNRTKIFADSDNDTDAAIQVNNCFSITDSTKVTTINGFYPMHTAMHTMDYLYLRVNTVINQTTSNFENVSHNHKGDTVPSHILAKIPRIEMPDGSVFFRSNDEVVYYNLITSSKLNELNFSVTDKFGRVVPQNNLGNNMGVYSNYATNNGKINKQGNLFCDFTLKLERLAIAFQPNRLSGFETQENKKIDIVTPLTFNNDLCRL